MLNPFPILLSFGLFAPLILRVVVGLYFLRFGIAHLKLNRHTGEDIAKAEKNFPAGGATVIWFLAALEGLCGAALVLGIFTQVAAILLGLLVLLGLMKKDLFPDMFGREKDFSLLLLAVLVSLLFSGAGFVAIDLPL